MQNEEQGRVEIKMAGEWVKLLVGCLGRMWIEDCMWRWWAESGEG